jgi:glutamyl-tRNA reductase
MGLALVGVSHHDVPLAALEEISRSTSSLAYDLVGEPHAGVTGAVLLSTCNRVEIYFEAEETRLAGDAVRRMFLKRAGMPIDAPIPAIGTDVARHLFSVAAGLDSMVVGEDEVSGQVRRALQKAREEQTTSSALERLFQSAAATSKKVSATTGLGAAGRSIATVALDLVEEGGDPIEDREVLVIGTGAFARVAHAALVKRGSRPPMVFSSSGRAHRFVDSHGGVAISQNDFMSALAKADVVVACSGAPHAILDMHTLAAVTEHRDRPLPVLDLALTKDVEDEARLLPSIRLIDLEFISRHAPEEHGVAVTHAQRVVNEAVEDFGAREAGRSADAVVIAMRAHVQELMERERTRALQRLAPETAAHVEESLHRLVGELLHEPTIRARQFTREGAIEEFESAVRIVFGIEPGPAR